MLITFLISGHAGTVRVLAKKKLWLILNNATRINAGLTEIGKFILNL